jgi:hypothetical protein
VDANLVLVPAMVTDPTNRLVTGLERENFDNNVWQVIKNFSTEEVAGHAINLRRESQVSTETHVRSKSHKD